MARKMKNILTIKEECLLIKENKNINKNGNENIKIDFCSIGLRNIE